MTVTAIRIAGVAAAAMLLAAKAYADDQAATPPTGGTSSIAANLDRSFMARQLQLVESRRASWLAAAADATPKLFRTPMKPVATVRVVADDKAFQGWRVVASGKPGDVLNKPWNPGDSFILDFGEHLTGQLTFSLRRFDIPVDAPVRLRFVFGEFPAEVAEPFDPYDGTLARSWLQDEVVNVDDVPTTVTLPRRYAFRYVKVTVVACSTHGRFGFSDLGAEAITSADPQRLVAFVTADPRDAAIDRVAVRTLRDCMQTVFEDGPKRDRRLWLGDLRLQAQANYATYRNFDLVKRSLYLLAGTATPEGLVSTCAFERPTPIRGGNSILDYTALFAPTVLDYLNETGDRATAEDLWPLVVTQLAFTLPPVDADGLFVPPPNWWLFVDWHPALDKQAAEHAIVLYGAKATRALAAKIGRDEEAAFLGPVIARMERSARERLWDKTAGVFVSGPQREISVASQAWMVLAGVPTPEQGRKSLTTALTSETAVTPVTPYMHHHVVAALVEADMPDEARRHLRAYWGRMIDRGADTFWEVYLPSDEKLSPYKTHLMNSGCHAWSCTPCVFLRNGFAR